VLNAQTKQLTEYSATLSPTVKGANQILEWAARYGKRACVIDKVINTAKFRSAILAATENNRILLLPKRYCKCHRWAKFHGFPNITHKNTIMYTKQLLKLSN